MTMETESRRSILVVDDEPGFRDMLQWYLGQNGLDVTVARNGEEAIELAAKKKFSLVITDVTMPRIDGLKLLETLKKKDPGTLVIVATGFGTVEMAVQAMSEGASDFVLKPFDLQDILSRVRKAFEKIACPRCHSKAVPPEAF